MAKSTLEELLKKQAELLKQIEEAKEEEAKEIKAESVKAFEIFKKAVDKRAFATNEDPTAIICELAGIKMGKAAKGVKGAGTRTRRTGEEVAAEKAELEKDILGFLKKQKGPVSAKVIREGIGAGDDKKLAISQILIELRDSKENSLVKMDGQKAGAVWSFLK